MEKRNVIQDGRTPAIDDQPELDMMDKEAVASFKPAKRDQVLFDFIEKKAREA